MQLTPRYDGRPILSIDIPAAGRHPVIPQRRRFVEVLRDLPEEEWRRPSRCAGWTVQDVVTHLSSTNRFWAMSIGAAVIGEPTRFLASFDPVRSPAELVAGMQGTPIADTLRQFELGVDDMATVIDPLDGAQWELLAEAPPGHLPIRLVADHALWDSWIHERDVLLPLGRAQVIDDDEVRCCLRYAAGLGRAFAVSRGDTDGRSMIVEVDDPTDRVVVVADGDAVRVHGDAAPSDALRVSGDAASLIDLLSIRDAAVDRPAGLDWLTAGLAAVFDQGASA